MKKIKLISGFLAVVMVISALNLGMMFTSFADANITISEAADLASLGTKIGNKSGTITITLSKSIDASTIAPINSIDATEKKIIFKGENYLIQNLNIIGGGLFTSVGEGSSFENVGLYNCTISDFAAASKEGYGFLSGKMKSGTVTNCFAAGTITVYGTPKYVGGLVGQFGGTMTKSYAMTDIYTDGSYVGGLIGEYIGAENSVTSCYATGSIDNDSKEYIGGLIGYSATSCVTDSYTSVHILNAYADTVKSIGVIKDLATSVYYDKNISLQRQGDLDTDHRCTSGQIAAKLNGDAWTNVSGHYPQLAVFYTSSTGSFKRISAVSAAVVDINGGDGYTTGREFTLVSTPERYSYATLTSTVDNTDSNQNRFHWRITGGIDEYYFDFNSTIPTNNGSTVNGLSGNTYDYNTGKYLFVNTGDVKFTAVSGNYERGIYVHVTTSDRNPYIVGGTGTASNPFLIDNANELDMMRLYCVDDTTGDYNYKINADIALSGNWTPIVGMKGTLSGNTSTTATPNNKIITGLNVTKAVEGNAGLIANSSISLTISDIHISNGIVNTPGAAASGVLIGDATNTQISRVFATGDISGAKVTGMLVGQTHSNTVISQCATYGKSASSDVGGGIVGISNGSSITDCYSTAVITGAEKVGGIVGDGTGSVNTSVFTGMVEAADGIAASPIAGGTVTVSGSYFDWQAAGFTADTANSKSTAELTATTLTINGNWTLTAGKYPRLSCFITLSNDTRYVMSFGAIPATYTYKFGTVGSSVAFTTAGIVPANYDGGSYDAKAPESLTNGTTNYSYASNVITTKAGGRDVFKFTDDEFNDIRYFLFNVNGLTIRYRFNYPNDSFKTEFLSDMNNYGLAKVTNKYGSTFNFVLDAGVTEFTDRDDDTVNDLGIMKVTPSTDQLSFAMEAPFKYGEYEIKVYTESAEGNLTELTASGENSWYIGGVSDLYVEFIVKDFEKPWGIYRVNTY